MGVAKHDRNGGPELVASACTCSSVDRFCKIEYASMSEI